ncbi:hypothetical protein JCM16307_19220 [Thermococcus prieurii]
MKSEEKVEFGESHLLECLLKGIDCRRCMELKRALEGIREKVQGRELLLLLEIPLLLAQEEISLTLKLLGNVI